jgi:hypothetical protein
MNPHFFECAKIGISLQLNNMPFYYSESKLWEMLADVTEMKVLPLFYFMKK